LYDLFITEYTEIYLLKQSSD